MQGQQQCIRLAAFEFDGSGFDQHVQRRFGGPVAVPAAETVVANAADLGRQQRQDAALAIEQAAEMAQHQRWAESVDQKDLLHLRVVHIGQALFWH